MPPKVKPRLASPGREFPTPGQGEEPPVLPVTIPSSRVRVWAWSTPVHVQRPEGLEPRHYERSAGGILFRLWHPARGGRERSQRHPDVTLRGMEASRGTPSTRQCDELGASQPTNLCTGAALRNPTTQEPKGVLGTTSARGWRQRAPHGEVRVSVWHSP